MKFPPFPPIPTEMPIPIPTPSLRSGNVGIREHGNLEPPQRAPWLADDLRLALAVDCPHCWVGTRGQLCAVTARRGFHRPRLVRAVRQLERTGLLRLACPLCLRDGYLIRDLDRIVHADGTDSRRCWAALSSGRTR